MYNANFNTFTPETDAKILDISYFYLGRYFYQSFYNLTIHLIYMTFLSIFYIGSWKWCITYSFYLGNILFKINEVCTHVTNRSSVCLKLTS